MTETAREPPAQCSCKVGTVAADCGLGDIHSELRTQWLNDDGPSVRTLTDSFNKRVLETAFRQAGNLPLDGEVDNIYRLLWDDDSDVAERTRARERLRQEGIPVDEVEEQLVSHQTLYRHLVECLDASYEPPEKSADERLDTWRTRMLALQNRTASVTAQGIEQLDRHDAVDIGSFDVTIDATVTCEDCGGFYSLEEFLDTGACDCQTES
ncbi:MAG: hypothetical protein V5A41_07580 [Haloarculaceae archaeon]